MRLLSPVTVDDTGEARRLRGIEKLRRELGRETCDLRLQQQVLLMATHLDDAQITGKGFFPTETFIGLKATKLPTGPEEQNPAIVPGWSVCAGRFCVLDCESFENVVCWLLRKVYIALQLNVSQRERSLGVEML